MTLDRVTGLKPRC